MSPIPPTVTRASIDLGTNTCLLLVAEWDSSSKSVSRILEDRSTIVRLGEGVDQHRCLQREPMERTYQCLEAYRKVVQSFGIDPGDVVCVATSQARDASNGGAFFERIQAGLGFRFRVLSGEEEARASFNGALLEGQAPESVSVIDIGGGSTEYTFQSGGVSLDIGAVRFTERYLKSDPVTDSEFWECQEAIDRALTELKGCANWKSNRTESMELLGVAGTVVTLARWFLEQSTFQRDQIDAVILSSGDVHRMVEELKWRTVEERKALTGIEAKRADVLLAGALILWRSMEVLGFSSCRVSTRGLRFGVLSL